MADFNQKFDEFNNTPDTTSEFDRDDIEKNKIMAILAYISWLVVIPLIAAKNSKYARFHANQGLVLAIVEFAVSIIIRIFPNNGILGWIFGIAGGLVSLACFILTVLGIINAANGKAKELPVIGGIRILK